MLFNSYEFIFLFLPVSLMVYFFLNRMRLTIGANAWLLFVSLFFYSWWKIRYLPLILGSILFNYTVGGLLAESDGLRKQIVSRKTVFVVGVIVNIIFLGYFKYMNFFVENVNTLVGTHLTLTRIVLPLGISFFTITQIAFLVDAYEGLVNEKNLLSYALFVSFFPHLLAGPILHHKEMMPQFETPRNKVVNYRNLTLGLVLFSIGLFKKIVIADNLAPLVDSGFTLAAILTFLESWVTCFSYALQLYFDFSGYSDMAIGIGWMFNISLPVNFNSPYKAGSVIDFWRRWHMTLTSFITTYIYTPILRGMGRITFQNSLIAIFLAMVVSGFWHGAGWTFIVWGTLHAVALVVNHSWRRWVKIMIPAWLARTLTFVFVAWSLVFFRAKSLAQALDVSKAMSGMNGFILPSWLEGKVAFLAGPAVRFGRLFENINGKGDVAFLAVMLVIVMTVRNSMDLTDRRLFRPSTANLVLIVSLICINIFIMNSIQTKEFLYFDF